MMHTDEFSIDQRLVRTLVETQFPQWGGLSLTAVPSAGTDHALFRLGKELLVRLPRLPSAVDQVKKDQIWLPRLAPRLPLDIPVPIGAGKPEDRFPWPWSVYRWLAGSDASDGRLVDNQPAAATLGEFVRLLRGLKFPEAEPPPPGRGQNLRERDEPVREGIESLREEIDPAWASALWESCLATPPWEGDPIWMHGDLLPTNLLERDGRLTAVIDFGCMGVGDPACDLIPAWSVFGPQARHQFRQAAEVDDDTWHRGLGWAFSHALLIIPYYRHTNPGLVAVARFVIKQLLEEE